MNSIHLTVKENEVINNPEPISQPEQGNDEIEIREINEENQEEVLKEMRRLIEVRMKYNIHTPPKPDHIKFEDYGFENKAKYTAEKKRWYNDYKTKCQLVENNITRLNGLNTFLCFEKRKKEDEIKIKNGTYYSMDEQEYIEQQKQEAKEAKKRKNNNAKYYEHNKTSILLKHKIKNLDIKIKEIDELKKTDPNVLTRGANIIKPLCLCGRQCDVTKITTIKKHSNIEKHRLFKSIIALIHYKRRNGAKLKPIIDKLNNDYIDYKRVVREKRNGKSVTITNKTDKEVIQLYGDYLNPIDENETHQPRKSYIEKTKITKRKTELIMVMRFEINKRTKNKS